MPACPRRLLGGPHQGRADAALSGLAVDEHLGDVGPVRLVLRLLEDDLHGAHDLSARPILRHEQDALARSDALGDALPERIGPLSGQRQHEADRGAALDAVDQHGGQGADLLPGFLRERARRMVIGSLMRLSSALRGGAGPRVGGKRHQIAGGSVGVVAKHGRSVEAHGQAVAGTEAIGVVTEGQVDLALDDPDLLMNDRRAVPGVVGHARARREHHLDQLDGRGEAGRREVAAHVAAVRIAPDALIGAARQGRGAGAVLLGEERGQGHPEAGGELVENSAVGLLSPRSIREIIERLTPVRSARPSRVRPLSARRSRRRAARWVLSAEVMFH